MEIDTATLCAERVRAIESFTGEIDKQHAATLRKITKVMELPEETFEIDQAGYRLTLPDPEKYQELIGEILSGSCQIDQDFNFTVYGKTLEYLACIIAFYKNGAEGNFVSPEMLLRVDTATFRLLPFVGRNLAAFLPYLIKSLHVSGVKGGKGKQKAKTEEEVRSAYGKLGADWDGVEEKKPILLKDRRLSIGGMAAEIFKALNGGPTSKTIEKHLKALREKGEI